MSDRYEKLANKFKSLIDQFLAELINITNRDYDDLILARVMLTNQVPVSLVIDEFIKNGLQYEDKVINKDEDFFLSDQNIFEKISKMDKNATRKFNLFKDVWNSIGEDNKQVVWTYVDLLFKIVKLCKVELDKQVV